MLTVANNRFIIKITINKLKLEMEAVNLPLAPNIFLMLNYEA